MAHRDIVVIGASVGGISALTEFLSHVPLDLPASMFVVVHVAPEGGGMLPSILGRGNGWQAAYAVDGEPIRPGRLYLAPPDHHLLIKPSRLQVVRGPRENRFRPAVDPLFRTAAESYGPRVIGIVLSGGLDDGTHGLDLVKRHGGLAIAQDPEEAFAPSMPLSAIQHVEVDHILRVNEIAQRLPEFVAQPVEAAPPSRQKGVPDVAEGTAYSEFHKEGRHTDLTCLECGGSLRELEGGNVLRFRCHVGHGYTADSLLADQSDGLDNAFWGALRALEEHSMLRRRMSDQALEQGRSDVSKRFEREARDTERQASTIRRILHGERPGGINGEPLATTTGRRKTGAKPLRPGTRTRRVNR
jgi:two-component system chemotaxis response regulator CheB